ncbi:hypothetical protein L798_13032 [Zootermopsis nevadensis]|uniref:Uncharacterized protein n=1 Tax=Zootermopsis nevadensis TaxID=136037 RepID=A0A067R2C9_ZOONE|nr:hypothetical protein L798_13032 [Zootermopsis nevadensis]
MDKIGKSVRKLWKAMGKQIRSSKPTKAGRRWKDIYRLGKKKSSRSEDQTASTYRSKPLDDSVGCSSAPQNFESVDINEQIRSVDDVDRAANLRRCPALEEDCVAVRWERDALKRTVKELELKLQAKQGTLERRNLYLEEEISRLTAENNSIRPEIQNLHDARTTETSEMLDKFGRQIRDLEDQVVEEILAIERKFIEANRKLPQLQDEMSIFEDAKRQLDSIFDDQMAENEKLEADLRELERALSSDNEAMIEDCVQQFAGLQGQLLRKIREVECNYISLNKDCLQVRDEKSIYEASRQQLEETFNDQIKGLCAQTQELIADVNHNEKGNARRTGVFRKEIKECFDGLDQQAHFELDSTNSKYISLKHEVYQLAEEMSKSRQRENAVTCELDRIAGLTSAATGESGKTQKWWKCRSSGKKRDEAYNDCLMALIDVMRMRYRFSEFEKNALASKAETLERELNDAKNQIRRLDESHEIALTKSQNTSGCHHERPRTCQKSSDGKGICCLRRRTL